MGTSIYLLQAFACSPRGLSSFKIPTRFVTVLLTPFGFMDAYSMYDAHFRHSCKESMCRMFHVEHILVKDNDYGSVPRGTFRLSSLLGELTPDRSC
jgi:hypothetical protein